MLDRSALVPSLVLAYLCACLIEAEEEGGGLNMQVFAYHVNNGIPVTTWDGEPNDTALRDLIQPLKELSQVKDVRTSIACMSDFHRCGFCKSMACLVFFLTFRQEGIFSSCPGKCSYRERSPLQSPRLVSLLVPVTGLLLSDLPSGSPDWSSCLSP